MLAPYVLEENYMFLLSAAVAAFAIAPHLRDAVISAIEEVLSLARSAAPRQCGPVSHASNGSA